jgi:uncharacterized membrane protein
MASVTSPAGPALVLAVPTGAGYSVLLLLHVALAIVGFGAVAVTGVQARRARRGPAGPGAEGVRRYFRPGVNWAGRALYGVPLSGVALLSASQGAFSAGDGFVVSGLGLWAVAAVVAEVLVWPGERRIQAAVGGDWATTVSDGGFDRQCRRVSTAAGSLAVVFLAAFVLMIAKP